MKNTIIITIDSERDIPIRIGKPEGQSPTTPEEIKEITLNDINCVAETLSYLIEVASVAGYCDKKEMMDKILIQIHTNLQEKEVDTEQEAFDKAKLIVENLQEMQQVAAAENFIDLYFEHFKNQERYNELKDSLKEKMKNLTL